MSKETTIEIKEEKQEQTQAPQEESQQAEALETIAEENKEQAEEHKEESKEAATEAAQAAETATKAAEQAKNSTSYNEYALKGLMDSVTLVAQRMEQVMNIAKQMAEDFQKVNEELRLTTELHQEQIAEIDSAANKVTTAAAALVRLHQEMVTPTE